MAKTRRATRKGSRKASRKTQSGGKRKLSSWNIAVMKIFKEMKAKDKNVKFGDALKEASKRKKAGKL